MISCRRVMSHRLSFKCQHFISVSNDVFYLQKMYFIPMYSNTKTLLEQMSHLSLSTYYIAIQVILGTSFKYTWITNDVLRTGENNRRVNLKVKQGRLW